MVPAQTHEFATTFLFGSIKLGNPNDVLTCSRFQISICRHQGPPRWTWNIPPGQTTSGYPPIHMDPGIWSENPWVGPWPRRPASSTAPSFEGSGRDGSSAGGVTSPFSRTNCFGPFASQPIWEFPYIVSAVEQGANLGVAIGQIEGLIQTVLERLPSNNSETIRVHVRIHESWGRNNLPSPAVRSRAIPSFPEPRAGTRFLEAHDAEPRHVGSGYPRPMEMALWHWMGWHWCTCPRSLHVDGARPFFLPAAWLQPLTTVQKSYQMLPGTPSNGPRR